MLDAHTLPRLRRELFIPVHGLVRMSEREMAVVDHPAFQRLAAIYQLGQTHLVFRGATHTRFEHVVGSVYMAQMLIDAVNRNTPRNAEDHTPAGDWELDRYRLNAIEVAFIRLGALLHDIGHLPAGHTLEDELGLLPKHDADDRLNLVLDRTQWDGVKVSRTLREVIDEGYKGFAEALRAEDAEPIRASDVVLWLVSKDASRRQLKAEPRFRLDVARDIIGNTICADLLDYLHRDWHHIGKPKELDTRLLEYVEIRRNSKTKQVALVINLGGPGRLRTDAITTILDLLESRYQLAEVALFHRTKTCASAMLERAIAEWHDQIDPSEADQLVNELLECSDAALLRLLRGKLEQRAQERNGDHKRRLEGAMRLLEGLSSRRLHKAQVIMHEYDLASRSRPVQELYAGDAPSGKAEAGRASARTAAGNRLTALRLLERDFGLDPGELAIYCPPRKMNTKIARAKILVHDHMSDLDTFESDATDQGLTGGHLAAQKRRFNRLWRVLLAIEPRAQNRLRRNGLIASFNRAVDLCLFGIAPVGLALEEAVQGLAHDLTRNPESPLRGRSVGHVTNPTGKGVYPTGVVCLLDRTAAL